jgi:H+/Cl- antiporter ClcA
VLLLNAIIGYQLLEDGTAISVGLVFASSAAIFIGTGYIALDTGFSWTHEWVSTLTQPNQAYALYTLYLLAPLVFIALFFILEVYLVLRVLGERRPLSKPPMHT